MSEWYVNQMEDAHNNRRWDDRRNYAQMAGIDLVKYFYLGGE